jgi:hypothetical protein
MIGSREFDNRDPVWMRFAGSLAVLWPGALLWLVLSAPAAMSAYCSDVGRITFICGVTNVADLAQAGDTKWVIGSDLPNTRDPQGSFYLFDTGKKTAVAVPPAKILIRPDKKTWRDCPGPVDLRHFSPHGLDLTRSGGTHPTLYVVNHGGRQAVEVFILDLSKRRPVFTWKGCIIAPQGFWPGAVASLPDGGIVVTSLWDPADPDPAGKLGNGQPEGAVAEWHPGRGWSRIVGSEGMSGPNGVIVSPDGKDIYVAEWAGRRIARISRRSNPPVVDRVAVGMLPGNLRWAPSGTAVFAGGQDATVQQVLACWDSNAVNCELPFKVYRMDPATLGLTEVVESGVYGVLGAGTGAIQVGTRIWVSSFRADRIGIFPVR